MMYKSVQGTCANGPCYNKIEWDYVRVRIDSADESGVADYCSMLCAKEGVQKW